MLNDYFDYNKRKGLAFEEAIINALEDVSVQNFGCVVYAKATHSQDIYEGTDFFFQDVPMDVTVNEGKDNTKYFLTKDNTRRIVSLGQQFGDDLLPYSVGSISFGIRLRSKKENFKRPVLVLSFDLPHLGKDTAKDKAILAKVRDSLVGVLNLGSRLYTAYQTSLIA